MNRALHRRGTAGHLLFSPSRPPTGFYLVRSGFVQLSMDDLRGHERPLAIATAPTLVGDPAPLFGRPPINLTATCMTACELSFWSYGQIHSFLRERPSLAAVLVYQTTMFYHCAAHRAVGLMWPCPRWRVLHTLVMLTRAVERRSGDNICRFPSFVTQTWLGNAANASRVTVNRVLASLRAQGMVIRTRPLCIRHPEKLEALLEAELAAHPWADQEGLDQRTPAPPGRAE